MLSQSSNKTILTFLRFTGRILDGRVCGPKVLRMDMALKLTDNQTHLEQTVSDGRDIHSTRVLESSISA